MRLRDYVENFLNTKGESISFRDKIIEILLESIFYCNIKFLKHIVSAKEEAPLSELMLNHRLVPIISATYYSMKCCYRQQVFLTIFFRV